MAAETEAMGNGEATPLTVVATTVAPTKAAGESNGNGSRRTRRRGIFAILGVVAILAFLWKGLPAVRLMLTHVSTDDAYVTGDATQVSARISDQAEEVLVNDNDYVEKSGLLVRLDQKPFRIALEQKRAALEQAKVNVGQLIAAKETAQAQLDQARDEVRAGLAGLHEAWRAIQSRQDQVRWRIASLRADIASLRAIQASMVLAQKEYDRTRVLVQQQTATQAELDQRSAALTSAQEQVKAAEQKVQQARALLALAPDFQHPEQVPPDLERTDADVRRALAASQEILAQLGLPFGLLKMEPAAVEKALEDVASRKSEDWFDKVPAVRTAKARYEQACAALGGDAFDPVHVYMHPTVQLAQKDFEDAERKFGYTEIRAPVSGYVNRRSVNPGDHVQEGQALLIIQPLDKVYVVANFKETQLSQLTIGQPVDLYVDAYPEHVFRGRVTGFAPATGAASSLLPAENATGNFVKVVQRLGVRVDLDEADLKPTPLFVGLSVVPEVNVTAEPTGPDAGRRLRSGTLPPPSLARTGD